MVTKRTFCAGPLVGELAWDTDGWWFTSAKGHKTQIYFGLARVTSPDDLHAVQLTCGPACLTVALVFRG